MSDFPINNGFQMQVLRVPSHRCRHDRRSKGRVSVKALGKPPLRDLAGELGVSLMLAGGNVVAARVAGHVVQCGFDGDVLCVFADYDTLSLLRESVSEPRFGQ